MPTQTTTSIARGVLESLSDDTLVLALPGTEYRLHLVPAVPASSIRTPVGKRISGRIRARALRIHAADGGGRFIEPVYGAPRIVAGIVRHVDEQAGEAVVDVSVPMCVTWPEGQDMSVLAPGALVNFYVESGTRFQPEP